MLWRLIRLEAFRRPLPLTALALLGLLAGALALLASGLGRHASALIALATSGSSDERTLEVSPPGPQADLARRGRFSAEDLALCDAQLGLLRRRTVYSVPVPAKIVISYPPLIDCEQALLIEGLATADLPESLHAQWNAADGPLPILAHPAIIAHYNGGIADRYGLPRITAEMIQLVRWQVGIGTDAYRQLPGSHLHDATLIGYHDAVGTWAVAVPLHRITPLVDRLAGPSGRRCEPARLLLEFADSADLPLARERLRAAQLGVSGEDHLVAGIRRLRTLGEAGSGLAILLLAAIAALLVSLVTALVIGERRQGFLLYLEQGAGLRHLLPIYGVGMALALAGGAAAGIGLGTAVSPWLSGLLEMQLLGPADERTLTPPALELGWWPGMLTLLTAPLLVPAAALPVLATARRTWQQRP